MLRYLTTNDVLLIHEDMINAYGGSHGVRDMNLVESAVARPQAGFGDFEAYPDLFIKVAVLCYSLLKNHPFVDGNKRTAMTAAESSLFKNGFEIITEKGEVYKLALDIENNTLDEEKIAQWLKARGKKIKK